MTTLSTIIAMIRTVTVTDHDYNCEHGPDTTFKYQTHFLILMLVMLVVMMVVALLVVIVVVIVIVMMIVIVTVPRWGHITNCHSHVLHNHHHNNHNNHPQIIHNTHHCTKIITVARTRLPTYFRYYTHVAVPNLPHPPPPPPPPQLCCTVQYRTVYSMSFINNNHISA